MSGEELRAYLAEIIELERKRYEISLTVSELKKKRNTYEHMADKRAGEEAVPRKRTVCGYTWKDMLGAFVTAGFSGIIAGAARKKSKGLGRELGQLNEEYRKTEYRLKEIYKDDIIYPKYQELFPVSRFYEYLSTGRCRGLEGYGGAYNLYENELLAKEILQYKNCRGSDC